MPQNPRVLSSAHLQAAQRTKHRPATYSGLTCSTGQPLANKAFRRHYLHEGVWLWHRTPHGAVFCRTHTARPKYASLFNPKQQGPCLCAAAMLNATPAAARGRGGLRTRRMATTQQFQGMRMLAARARAGGINTLAQAHLRTPKDSRILRRLQAGGCSKDSNKAPPRSAQQVHAAPVHKSNQAPC
jgi:hypothetical protein